MTSSAAGPWTWRERARDPRFAAILVLAAAVSVPASAVFGFDLLALVFIVLVAVAIGLAVLPRWRDERHGPATGAAVILAGALIAAAVGLVLHLR